VLPWDSEIFGFKVASYVPADLVTVPRPSRALAQALRTWMHSQQVELFSCRIPASSFSWMNFLGESGFLFVDVSLLAFARRLTNLPVARIEVRPAVDEDLPRLMEIAGDSFKFGRYHADARFPKAKADERYRWWIRNAMSARGDRDLVYVCGAKGQPTGFIHIVYEGTTADLRLAAVDASQNAGILGQGLFVGALQHMVSRGARSAKARLSAGNTTVLNLYSSLDFAFQEADVIYHLHAPDSRHLSLGL
jgi:hypothetical protein